MGGWNRGGDWSAQMFEASSSAMFVYTLDGALVDINPAACELHGWTREEMLAKQPEAFIAPESMPVFHAFREALARGEDFRGRAEGLRADGGRFDVEVYGVALEIEGERFLFASLTDVTEELRLREKLAESQRMDALGRLAGGIAHDFNNMLMVVMACAEMAQRSDDPEAMRELLGDVRTAASRAAELTTQLLSFSRHRTIRRTRVDVHALLARALPLLGRVLPDDVTLEVALAEGEAVVAGEPAPLEQVVVNLVLNARDALPPGGGRITVSSRERTLDRASHPDIQAGRYIELVVEDDGVGMSDDTQRRIFEPFFTTKEGHGTGLGLSTAFGVVRQHGGDIVVYSEPGRGTTFRVFLPLATAGATAPQAASVAPSTSLDGVRVLVVDDDTLVRDVVVRILRRAGAQAEGVEAERAEAHVAATSAELLVTDVVMPGQSGVSLYARLRRRFPALRVLYLSGYTADHLSRGGLLDPDLAVLAKPFGSSELLSAVHQALEKGE